MSFKGEVRQIPVTSVSISLIQRESQLCGQDAATFCLEEEVTPLSLLQLRAEGTTVSWVLGGSPLWASVASSVP